MLIHITERDDITLMATLFTRGRDRDCHHARCPQVFHKVLGAGSGKRMLQDLDDSEREEVREPLVPECSGSVF